MHGGDEGVRILHRALTSAHVPSRLEPSGIYHSDGKHPDGITVIPRKSGKLLLPLTSQGLLYSEAGAVAALVEERKKNIYAHLDPSHSFTPVAVETSGVVGPQSLAFLEDLGRRMRQVTGEERSLSYLLQRVSVAVQRGNAASVLGTTGLAVPDTFLVLINIILFYFSGV